MKLSAGQRIKSAPWPAQNRPIARRKKPMKVRALFINLISPIPDWGRDDGSASNRCPLYPQKQTSELSRVMSALCQKRTLEAQKKHPSITVACLSITERTD